MFLTTVIAYLPYALITTFTPGPNNLISFYAVSTHGWRRGARVLAGIGSAILLIMLITAVFCYQLAEYLQPLLPMLKLPGAAYILWLALQIAKDKPGASSFSAATFGKGFLLVFINVKMVLYALTVFSSYILTYTNSLPVLIAHAILLTLLCIISNFTWAAAGSLLQKFLAKHYRPFNITMALILAYCAITLIID